MRATPYEENLQESQGLNLKQRHKALLLFVTTLLYAFAGIASLKLASINHSTSPFWPPSGIASAAVYLFGWEFSVAVFFGAFLTNLTTGMNFLGVSSIACGNTLEAIVFAWTLKQLLARGGFGNYAKAISMPLAAIIGAVASATTGTFTLALSQTIPISATLATWVTWLGGDIVGMLVFAPFFVNLASRIGQKLSIRTSELIEFIVYALFTVAINICVFPLDWPEGIYWAICIILLLAHIRLGPSYSQGILVLNNLLAIFFTVHGYPLFEHGNNNVNLLYLQTIAISFAITSSFFEALLKQDLPRLPITLLSSGLAVIATVVSVSSLGAQKERRKDLERLIERAKLNLFRNETTYSMLLKSTASMMSIQTHASHKAWSKFVSGLNLNEHYNAIHGLGFATNLQTANISTFIKGQIAAGQKNYKIWFIDQNYAQKFETIIPVTFIEPFEMNNAALGLDLGSERLRREGALLSASHNAVYATRPIRLVQDSLSRFGFLIFYPVFDQSSQFKTDLKQLLGWVYAPVISNHFFYNAFESFPSELLIRVEANGDVIYGKDDLDPGKVTQKQYLVKKSVKLFGIEHTIWAYPKSEFFLSNSSYPLVLGVAFTIIHIIFVSLVANVILFNSRLTALVDQKSKELVDEKAKSIHASKLASLGEMSAGIAHEINNPLAIIVGTIPLLKTYANDATKLASKLDTIAKASFRIEKIVKGLRKFSRTSETNVHKPEDLATIVSEALTITESKSKRYSTPVTVEIGSNLTIQCDSIEIEQVLINLINNAIDAVKNLPEKWVRISGFKDGDQIVLQVMDSGQGISKEIEEKLFQPFFTTKPVGEGTGLGLSISKGILDQHKASFALNRNFKNTCFEIRFLSI